MSSRVGNQSNQLKLSKRVPVVVLPRVVGQGEQEAQTQIEEEVEEEVGEEAVEEVGEEAVEEVGEEAVEEVEEEVVVEGDWWKKMIPNKE